MSAGDLDDPIEQARFALANPQVTHSPQMLLRMLGHVLVTLDRTVLYGGLDVVERDLESMRHAASDLQRQAQKAWELFMDATDRIDVVLGEPPKPSFAQRIRAMNEMYKLPINDRPMNLGAGRMGGFNQTISDEVTEGAGIQYRLNVAEGYSDLDALTDLADWLGDIVVYCRSEALKWGIPLEEVLEIIMDSNASKLGADGKPIYDANGKFLKGPNYWKPEPKIRALLESRLAK